MCVPHLLTQHFQFPVELMLGRPMPTILPSCSEKTQTDKYHEHIRQTSDNQKRYAAIHTKPLPPLVSDQHVCVLDNTRVWARGTVLEPCVNKDRSYLVHTDRGSQLVRNNSSTESTMPKPLDITGGHPCQTGSDGRQTLSGRAVRIPARYRDNE